MSDPALISILFALLACSAMCSGSETALFSTNKEDLRQRIASGDPLSGLVQRILDDGDRLLLAILIANNGINVAFFALASYWSAHTELAIYPFMIPVIALVSLILLGEIIPKVIASEQPLIISRWIAPAWMLILTLLTPLLIPLQKLLQPLLNSGANNADFPTVTAEELKLVIEQSHRQGVVSSFVHDRLVEVIGLSLVPAYKVMTHRLDCCCIPRSASYEEAVQALRIKPSHYLMLLDDEENCIGILGAQHLLKSGRPGKRMRKPSYIPAAATLAQVIEIFQEKGTTAGVVVDEYGGTDGLITLAHLAQVLLGESTFEEDSNITVEQLDEHRWRLSGNAPIAPWKPILQAPNITEEVTTISGFLSRISGAVPQQGDRLIFNNLLFIVEETHGLRISTVLIEKLPLQEARRLTRQEFS
ncbi:MAG: DUF21 domain-containing protein [Planctomycetota bacterium]|nr:MAG: DUF21 domain-containing protein [Planctomycetota bacterium]